jgi:hypothetical protein
VRGCLHAFGLAENPPHPALRADLSPQAGRGEKKKGRDRSRPFVFVDGRVKPGHDNIERYFASARFGGVAGHDLTSVS